MNVPNHIQLDIAVETIGKVKAVYFKKLKNLDAESNLAQRIEEKLVILDKDVQNIYAARDVENILLKVSTDYIPFLQKELNFTPHSAKKITAFVDSDHAVHA